MIGTEGNILATERFKGDDTQYYLYNKDIQGSTTSLVKEDGSADATYQYTDYGETIIHGDDQAKNEVCYTGGIYDQSTGLYYLNARYYNPVNYVDPSGHFLVSTAVLVGVGVGGIVGAIAGSYKGRLVAKRLGYKGKEIVYKFVYNYKEKIIEGTCIAKKGVVKLSDAWVKTIGL